MSLNQSFISDFSEYYRWVGLDCYLTADILTKVLQRCSLSSLLPNIWILSKPLDLIGCHGYRKDKFAKNYLKKKSFPQKP